MGKQKKFFTKVLAVLLCGGMILSCCPERNVKAAEVRETEYIGEEGENERIEAGEIVSDAESGLITVNYNVNLIAAVGKQGTNMCMAYTLAYCRTILDGTVHAGSEYWQNGIGGMPSWAGYVHSGASEKQSFLRLIVEQINQGNPVGMYVKNRYRSNQAWSTNGGDHWVAVIGYKASADINNLKTSDFYIIDPGECGYDYLSDNEDSFSFTTNHLLISTTSGSGTGSLLSNTGVTNITNTTAKINAKLPGIYSISEAGFYFGTSPDNMTKVVESASGNVEYVYYTLGDGKWWSALSPGTTYYYRIYVIINGATHMSAVDSFTTTGAIADTQPPTVTNAYVSQADKDGYTVVATVSDNIGVGRVAFPTRHSEQGDSDWIWYEGIKNADGSFYCRVNVSDFDNREGNYWTDIYAYDLAGNGSACYPVRPYIDRTPPTITNATVEQISAGTVKISCEVADNSKVTGVAFPTWTEENGQDDINGNWVNECLGVLEDSKYIFYVKDSEHNYEHGQYKTHIYAFDEYGNSGICGINYSIENTYEPVETINDGHIYELYDDILTWEEAKEKCEELGGHLVTITSPEEQAVIQQLLSGSSRGSYFIGGRKEGENSVWITGEPFDYTNWCEGEPNNSYGREDVYEIFSHGFWNDCCNDKLGGGFICEYDAAVSLSELYFSETEIEIEKGNTKELEIISEPEVKKYHLTWESSDQSVVTVSNGVITALGAGTAEITAEYGNKKATCEVTVRVPVDSIGFTQKAVSLVKGQREKLVLEILPEEANTDKEIIWNSSNPKVATVNKNGLVVALSQGETEITATLKADETKTDSCMVTVTSCFITFETYGGTVIGKLECSYGESPVFAIEPVKEGYVFDGWYKDEKLKTPWIIGEDKVTSDITLYAKWTKIQEGLWIKEIPAQEYTGTAVKPEVEVYAKDKKLVKGKDYTVSYKNNINANENMDSANAPQVVIKGKGNYKGSETANFVIRRKALDDENVSVDDLYVKYTGKAQTPKFTVKYNGKKLKSGKDYSIQGSQNFSATGTYSITLSGMGNYKGSRKVKFVISNAGLLNKAQISSIAEQIYSGEEIEPSLTVRLGGLILTEGTDYSVEYENNVEIGTATAIVTGINSYSGMKKVSFKIVGSAINKVYIAGITDIVYDGTAAVQEDMYIMDVNGNTLTEGVDYTVTYSNNTKAGTATMLIKGINQYSGSVKKKFKVLPYNIETNEDGTFYLDKSSINVSYEKGGVKPLPTVKFKGKVMTLGTDFTLKYKDNQKAAGSQATMIITGKGNFTGSVEKTFLIQKSTLATGRGIKIDAADKVYVNKKNNFKVTPVLYDVNGKKLSAGKDYEKVYQYCLVEKSGRETKIAEDSILPAGSIIRVYVQGKENYTGTVYAEYRITQSSFSKAKVTITPQEYTGEEVTLKPEDITVKVGQNILTAKDYEIIGYENNIKKGNATVILKGKGNYGGTKRVKFAIRQKSFIWWWR